uniref:Pleckstrin homology domain containing, family A member 5 n=1 Tax=Salmo trutta TaxID=8032 RepID=A0A674EQM8_SALTR
MAADLNPDWLSCLPSSWSYGVTRDGRIFFINEEAKSTTWLHPVTGEAVITGHRKTPDLPTGWEEGYTFEGARCFINHNERKVTCKHPVSGLPSQDNCIFVVNEHVTSAKLVHPVTDPGTVNPVTVNPVTVNPVTHPVTDPVSNRPKAPEQAPSEESDRVKKERPMSTMSEASNYTGGSDYSTYPGSSPATRPSRSYKKVHNFGKRSNSIKRNPNAPAVKSNWLYKQATHSNMRTYYFCTDTAKDMESWMKVMTDAALVHTEPIRRLDKLKVDRCCPQEVNNILNHNRVLTRPEIQNNERNLEPRQPSITRSMDRTDGDRKHKDPEKHTLQRERERYTLQKDGERYSLQKDGVSYTLQRDGERYLLQKDGERYALQKDGERYSLQKDGGERYSVPKDVQMEKYAPQKDGEKYMLQKDGERYALQKEGERYTLQKDGQKYNLQKGVERQTSMTEKDRSDRYGTLDERQKYKTLREGSKCGTVRDGEKHGTLDKYGTLREVDKYGTLREGNKYGFQRDGSAERPLTKINSIKLQPAQAAAIAAAVTASRQVQVSQHMAPHQVNGSGERAGDHSPGEVVGTLGRGAGKAQDPPQNQTHNQQAQEPEKSLTRTNSMRQLENWVRTQRTQEDDDTRSITSYQTLPRNMPSHHAQIVPRYPEGYRTLPRNMLSRPESICSVAGSVYDRALAPTSNSDKRRSMRDDTMWQLYEWQQRQAFSRQGPPPPGHYGTLPSPKTMGNISEHQGVAHSIPTSPSHGSLALYHTFSPPGQHRRDNPPGSTRSEVSSPVFRGDQTMTVDCRHRTHLTKYNYPPDRRSMPAVIPVQTITPQSLQGKTISPEDYKDNSYSHQRPEDIDIDTKLSRLCEQDQVVRTQEEKLQQLHREKHTLETALLSASQEIEQSSDNPAAVQSLIQQRDVLQNGLLSTCRELARVNTELERSWREYDKMESGVSLAKTNLLEQLEALGSPQTEPPSQQHVQIQKELWRIQDVMEALAKNKPQRTTDTGFLGSKPISNLQKNEQGPDYRLYKSEPELTTVAEEVDDNNGEDNDRLQTGLTTDKEPPATKVPLGVPVYPVGIVPPRTKSPMSPPESCTIASYVTLRKSKKPDPRTERPHSAVEQTCGPGERESGRARMSVEEQLERIRRHQQASLREKKRSSSSISPSRSPSFSKENPFITQVRLEVFSTDTQELEAALQDLEEVRDRVTEQLERDRTAAVELERDRGAELELERDRAAAAAEEEMERGRAAIEKLERDMTEVAAVVEQEMARTAVAVEEEMARTAVAVEEELDRAAELELERDRAAVAAAAEELERARAAAEELVRERTAVSSEEALDVDKAALVELEMEITVVEEISYRAEEVDVIPVPRLSEEQPQPRTESSNMDTEVSETQMMVISDQGVKPLYVQYLIPGQHRQQGEREAERRNTHTPNTFIPHNSLPAAVSEALTPEPEKDVMQSEVMQGEAPEHETQGNNIDISYELPVEGAKLNNLMAVKSLPFPPKSSSSPASPPQLTDGSHFMCV